MLSACTQHSIKRVLRVTKPLNALDGVIDTVHYQHGCKELPEGAGGTFGRLTLFNTATYQELLDYKYSKAHNFKEEWEGKTMQAAGWGCHEGCLGLSAVVVGRGA